jgi:hypothetical protein
MTMIALRMFAAMALPALALLALGHGPPARAAERVGLLLVLAADTSSSVNEPEFQLQRKGHAAALADPRVISAIRATPGGRIAVAYVEWSGPWTQKLVVDWTLVDGLAAGRRLGARIAAAPRAFSKRSTSIGDAIDFSAAQFGRAPFQAPRRVIDISGDGDSNTGRPVAAARDAAIARGITVNGLVIRGPAKAAERHAHSNPPGGLARYYRRNVIGGPGAFVLEAEDHRSFGSALVRKLVREIALSRP